MVGVGVGVGLDEVLVQLGVCAGGKDVIRVGMREGGGGMMSAD
jgi:hypothetical protein